jgi:hypothetical protein
MPSRLAPGERLGETTAAGELKYVPEGQREGWKQPIMFNEISPTSSSGAGEPSSMFNEHLANLSGDDIGSIPGSLTHIPTISIKAQAGVNTLRSNITADSFAGVKTVDDVSNVFGKVLNAGSNVIDSMTNFFTTTFGLNDAAVSGKDFVKWLNTPIEAISTNDFGIKPLDIMLVVAGGMPALGTVVMGKVMNAMFKPVTTAFKDLFGGTATVSDKQNVKDNLAHINQSYGGQAAGMIDKGTYYNSSGQVLATGMQALDFGANAAGSGSRFAQAVVSAADNFNPFNKTAHWDPATGEVIVENQDGTLSRTGEYVVPNDANNKVYQGGGGKSEGDKVEWGFPIIEVTPIEMVSGSRGDKKGGGKKGGSIWDWIKDNWPGDKEDDDEKKDTG